MDKELEVVLRNMQWQRAKGELNSFIESYTSSYGDNATLIEKELEVFIKKIERILDYE